MFCLFSVSCISQQEREYRHICDSLSNLDFPPRVFDTLFFQKYGNGFEVDTIYSNGEHHNIQRDYKYDYVYIIKYANTPVIDFITYGGDDGKILDWHQRYYNWEDISSYWAFYDKDGKVYDYYICGSSDEGYVYPNYSIHQLIEKLRKENIDLFHNISIYYYGKDYWNKDSILHKRWGWYVDIKDTIDSNDGCNMTGRLYDSQTGKLLDVYRGLWKEFHSNKYATNKQHYRLKRNATKH